MRQVVGNRLLTIHVIMQEVEVGVAEGAGLTGGVGAEAPLAGGPRGALAGAVPTCPTPPPLAPSVPLPTPLLMV